MNNLITSLAFLDSFFLLASFFCIGTINGQENKSFTTDYLNWEFDDENSWEEIWLDCSRIAGYAERPEPMPQIRIVFEPLQIDALGNFCKLSGQLQFQSPDDETWEPINWFQGILLNLSVGPDINDELFEGDNLNINQDLNDCVDVNGRFQIEFDIRDIARAIKLPTQFQVFALLANHDVRSATRHRLTWTRHQLVDALKHSVVNPSPPPQSVAVCLINTAAGWRRYNSDPTGIDLLNAVNHLQGLGKDETVRELRQYLALTEMDFDKHYDDNEIVYPIVQLLFEPAHLDGRQISGPAPPLFGRNDPRQEDWPLDPIVLVEGVPFSLDVGGYGGSGIPYGPGTPVDWAEKYAVIRDKPIVPRSDPVLVVEQLLKSQRFAEVSSNSWSGKSSSLKNSFRNQALAMTKREAAEYDPDSDYSWQAHQDVHWVKMVEQARRAPMIWSEMIQEFLDNN